MTLGISRRDCGHFAISETGSAEQQNIIKGDAGAASQRAEPRIGELPRRESVFGGGKADLGFAAIDKASTLPIEPGVQPSGNALRTCGIVIDTAPFIAERRAGIGPGPVEREVTHRGVIVGRCKAGGKARHGIAPAKLAATRRMPGSLSLTVCL